MSKDQTYNGWTNYELWMDNDEGVQTYWRETASEVWEAAEADDILSRSQRACMNLEAMLKDSIEENNPLAAGDRQPDLYTDLLQAAISEVDWHELADTWLEAAGCEGYEPIRSRNQA